MSDFFNELFSVNVNEHTEKKNGLTYLSWSWAWSEIMKRYPEAKYEIKMFDGKPYLKDDSLGYLVMTSMEIEGTERTMWLPVMDGANKAMKPDKYTYLVKEYKNREWTGGYIEKEVEAATMFDVNTAIMRCLVKNIAMFGLGLYIYSGEDLPPDKDSTKAQAERISKLCEELNVNQEALYRKYGIFDGRAATYQQAEQMLASLEKAKMKKGKTE